MKRARCCALRASRLPDWLIEEGIAEHRAVQMNGDTIVAARVEWPGRLAAGWVIEATLLARAATSSRGAARAASGEDVLVDRLPKSASEGAGLRLLVTRAALGGAGRLKRAQARPSDAPLAQPSLAQRLGAEGNGVQRVRRFPGVSWDELLDEALTGTVEFAGGSLLLAPTPAMTTVDIDGDLPARALALAALPALARTLERFDLGGPIAVDFPTLPDKSDRRAIDTALGEVLAGWPHERTAMNGFGMVQIVSRLERASLLHLATYHRRAMLWRRLLRRAEALAGAGRIELTIHPGLDGAVGADHLAELERRTGKRVSVQHDPDLAIDAPHAQLVGDG
jgi:ribonuclease G